MSGKAPLERFKEVERVIADPLRFKLKLAIGEDAYASLRLRKNLSNLWEVCGAAATGAGVAASPAVASTFFASTASGGLLSWIGLGTAAATPVGWIIAAALVSGGAYYGVVRVVRKFAGSRVDTIPKFINTPIDLLGATLLDLIGGLSMRLALADGGIDEAEVRFMAGHFVGEWGFDRAYVESALELLRGEAAEARVKKIAATLAEFQMANPDCNAESMSREIMQFLRDVAEADGRLDEREELALDAIQAAFTKQRQVSLAKIRRAAGDLVAGAASVVNRRVRGNGAG